MRRKKMLNILATFLVFMMACTMLSRASASLTVAVVQTASPGKMVITHKVTATGTIQENQERAISMEANQKISQIFVHEGDSVNQGDVLLQVDAGTLEGQIADCRRELKRIQLERAALESAKRIQEDNRALAIQRAQEDYNLAVAKGDQAVEWAAHEREQAILKLGEYYHSIEIEQEQEFALAEAADAAQKAYEEAVASREDEIQKANRALEDACAEEPTDNSILLKNVDAREKKLQLKKLEKLQTEEGKLLSPIKGVVTKLQVSPGEVTTEAPLFLLADLTAGCRFTAQVDRMQEEYLEKGAPVILTNAQKKQTVKDLKIDSVGVSQEDSSLLEVNVYLSADVLEIGDSAEMTIEKKSQAYNTCIPIQALHQANGVYFVYVIQETSTIMGEQLMARSVNVTVQEQNEMYAALDDGCLSSSQRVIRDSSKTIDEGSSVRLEQP